MTNFGQPCEVRLNDGSGRFTDDPVRLGGAEATLSAEFGDLDGDGDLDILMACFMNCANSIWFNVTPQRD
jgi:hypothetical protein